jgi:hypothetical protein
LEANLPESGQQRATLGQSISGAAGGTPWYLSVDFTSSGYAGDGCYVEFGTDLERVTTRYYSYEDPMPSTGDIYASGVFSGSPTWFYLAFVCESRPSSPIERRQAAEVWASFDDFSLTYSPPVPEQLLINNDFSTGRLDPWVAQLSDGRSTFNLVDGMLVATSDPDGSMDGYAYQQLSRRTNAGQTVRLQADVYLTVPEQSGSCYLTVTSGSPTIYQATNFDHTQHLVIDTRVVLDGGDSYIVFYLSCPGSGTGPATIALDNVYFTVNLEPSDTPEGLSSTSTTSEAPSSTPTPTSGPRQVILNNDFESGTLNPWTTQSYNGGSEPGVVENGRAIVKFTILSSQTWSQATFEQYLPGITSDDIGKSARVEADVFVNIGEAGTSCFVLIMSSDDSFWRKESIVSSQNFHVDVTIILKYATPMVSLFFGCNGDGTSTYVAFDNVYYYVDVPPSTSASATTVTSTPTPTVPARRQLITNNDFSSGSLAPWTEVRYSDYSDPVVVEDGRAIARIPRIVTTNWAQGSFDQTLYGLSSADIGKLATVQADVYVNIAAAGSKCFVQIYSVDDNFWRSGDILSSQTFHVDSQITLQYASAGVSVFWGCYGTGTTTSVAIDNLYYYVDEPGSVTSSSSSSSSDSSTSTATSTSTEVSTSSSTSSSSSSSTSSSTTPPPSVRATVSCPANDAQTYTNDDGSQYMIVCGQDYDSNNIVGINPVSSANFTACVDLCMYQGTECAGVSYFAAQTNCYLKTKMAPSVNNGAVVYSAIRISGPASGPVASRVITNGNFITDLSSWTTSQQTSQGGSFVWDNGRAYVISLLTAMF